MKPGGGSSPVLAKSESSKETLVFANVFVIISNYQLTSHSSSRYEVKVLFPTWVEEGHPLVRGVVGSHLERNYF